MLCKAIAIANAIVLQTTHKPEDHSANTGNLQHWNSANTQTTLEFLPTLNSTNTELCNTGTLPTLKQMSDTNRKQNVLTQIAKTCSDTNPSSEN